MISPKEATNRVKNKYSNRIPSAIFDYDETRYIVAAPLEKDDYNGCFFSVNKSTGDVLVFAPGEDYDKFFNAIDNKGIQI